MITRSACHIVGHAELPWPSFAEHYMGMPAQREKGEPGRRFWTEAEFEVARDAAPSGERWELVDGEVLVTPSPHWLHQRVVGRLLELLAAYVRARRIGEAFVSPLDVKLEPGLVLQPDLLVVPWRELRATSDVVRRLLLAVEVISLSSARYDRVTKRPAYQRNRVPEYWIVDSWSRIIERWHPSDDRPDIVSEQLEWTPEGATMPFTLRLPDFFSEVLPEGEDD